MVERGEMVGALEVAVSFTLGWHIPWIFQMLHPYSNLFELIRTRITSQLHYSYITVIPGN